MCQEDVHARMDKLETEIAAASMEASIARAEITAASNRVAWSSSAQQSPEVVSLARPIMGVDLASTSVDSSVKVRIGDSWVDITDLGDLLIETGHRLNTALKPQE